MVEQNATAEGCAQEDARLRDEWKMAESHKSQPNRRIVQQVDPVGILGNPCAESIHADRLTALNVRKRYAETKAYEYEPISVVGKGTRQTQKHQESR
jgi:hypothetical protein